MNLSRRTVVIVCAVACAFAGGIAWTAVLQHRSQAALEASIAALEAPRVTCVAAHEDMHAEQDRAQAALDATPLAHDAVEVESLALTLGEADATDGCDMGPGDTVEANEDVAAWLGSSALDAGLIQDALVGGQDALADAEADAAAQEAADALAVTVTEAEQVAAAAQSVLDASAGEVADEATRIALADALAILKGLLGAGAPDDAEAASYVELSGTVAGEVAKVTAASDAVVASQAAWEEAQSEQSTASASSGTTSAATSPALTKASASEFCAALNAARTANGSPAFTSCGESGAQVAHAKDMAAAADIWHTGNENIVGFSYSLSSLMSAFMSSSQHRSLILTDGQAASAQVGCFWREGSPRYLYCAAAFSW